MITRADVPPQSKEDEHALVLHDARGIGTRVLALLTLNEFTLYRATRPR